MGLRCWFLVFASLGFDDNGTDEIIGGETFSTIADCQ